MTHMISDWRLTIVVFTIILSGCGGSSGGGGGGGGPPPVVIPTAQNGCHAFSVNQNFTGQMSASGQSLVYEVIDRPVKGALSTDATGNFNYVPRPGLRGLDRFTFRVRDNMGQQSNIATVSLLIDGAVRIMPLGDSITQGTLTSTTPPVGQAVGYRRKLYNDLVGFSNNRFGVNFVGSEAEGLSASPAIGDADHEGHGGMCAGGLPCPSGTLTAGIRGWLDANPADIVLLHAGTNDLGNRPTDTSASGITTLLDEIDVWEATNHPVTVFVARIIKDVPGAGTDRPVDAYNNSITDIVAARTADRLVLVDMQDGANLNYGDGQFRADMADNLHPNASGYDKMAAKWLTELTNRNNVGARFPGLPECP